MSKPKFTPGPWQISTGPWQISSGTFVYALNNPKDPRESCHRMWSTVFRGIDNDDNPIPIEEAEATARLIAAAPELYELAVVAAGINNGTTKFYDLMRACERADELVKKIDGEEPT